MARADLHGNRACPAVPARPRCGARRVAPAAQPQRVEGRGLHRPESGDRPVAGPAATVRRVLQLLVHRDLRVAVHLPGGLPDPADRGAHPQPAGHPGTRPAQPEPAAQECRRRGAGHAGVGCGGGHSGPAGLAHRHPHRRSRHRDLGGEGVPARVRQHRLPLLAAGPVGGRRGGQAVRLRGQRHRRRQRRPGLLHGIAGGVRFLPGRQQRRRHLAVPDVYPGQGLSGPLPVEWTGHVVRLQHRVPGRPGSGRRHLAAVPTGGQPPAAGGRGPGLSAGPRLRADVHRHLPGRAEAHPDVAVPAGQHPDPAVVGHRPLRPARRALPGRSTAQAADRHHRTLRAHE